MFLLKLSLDNVRLQPVLWGDKLHRSPLRAEGKPGESEPISLLGRSAASCFLPHLLQLCWLDFVFVVSFTFSHIFLTGVIIICNPWLLLWSPRAQDRANRSILVTRACWVSGPILFDRWTHCLLLRCSELESWVNCLCPDSFVVNRHCSWLPRLAV